MPVMPMNIVLKYDSFGVRKRMLSRNAITSRAYTRFVAGALRNAISHVTGCNARKRQAFDWRDVSPIICAARASVNGICGAPSFSKIDSAQRRAVFLD